MPPDVATSKPFLASDSAMAFSKISRSWAYGMTATTKTRLMGAGL